MEIHIGNRIANVTLVNKNGNKVQFLINEKPYDVDIVMIKTEVAPLHNGDSNRCIIRSKYKSTCSCLFQ